ncbi:cyclopentanone 1,2-monooxygenase [Ampelomyces quisqualis]|uniref:Cyclopentanone 1,2-monooxygenase n=1 Tax=Ampelomyces quisqualis TaxID=50730 RepID=A0A6A5QSB8_AMPQU|nr:cyclopentanone 1,2-monooxygenase [Ampelomyces quisqualis]
MGSISNSNNISLRQNNNGIANLPVQELDALIVGAGFGGIYQLKKLRDAGFNVKLVEHGADYGGVWYWNRYPGARVDSHIPFYELSDPALWEDWTWMQRFPGGAEIRAYFAHVAEKWDLRKDTQFNTFVSEARWDEHEAKWMVKTESGKAYKVRFLLLNTGFAARRYVPDWKGIESFTGNFLHSSYWPHENLELKSKRVAIIGTGSTGVQLAEELSKVAGHLTIFQRTPNTSLPMGQVNYDRPKQAIPKSEYSDLFADRMKSFAGFSFNFLSRATFDDTPEQRNKQYEKLWAKGDFEFWLATYPDMLFSKEANKEAYDFWRNKTRARINDPKIADILAPMQQRHAFGCKRISLELEYFEIFNKPNVSLIDVSKTGTPIQEITAQGIKTTEQEFEFDFIVAATGYDAITGGIRQINIKGVTGESLSEYWNDGAKTYLGLAVSGYPNMFFTYGPQAPTALCNGPTCAELQGNWIIQAMEYMRKKGLRKIDAQKDSERKWKEDIWKFANASLLSEVDSWYMGTNIPGKPREPLIYLGGVPTYYKTIHDVAADGYSGFTLC